ncbi:hypothetical protein tinsulaeT_18950 [Thalassotalea insulae]|uniref:SnoaL-like domain-containing protein n=1 Tax=Thalassotalea insulae TaxID=2056778 RepID=A0ABQ6GRI4_9GAMM|nr:nuclear transport factor 2 family protein [Thalassotalea insulae]GLX78555.1 hypothetical protein tinsulaeT_18950 [Thalassotalea insulae]
MAVQNKPFKYRFIALLALSATMASQASEETSTPAQANLKKALYCMDILENRPDLEPSQRINILRNECFAADYIQHSPHVKDGREEVLKLFENRFNNHREITTSIKRTATQGDLVWIHQHVKRTPSDLGRAVVNIFRMEDGKFAEHWNVVQSVPDKSKNNNTMF